MSAALLPCPFCGGTVQLEKTHKSRDEFFGERQWWGVRCTNTVNVGGTCAIEAIPTASPEAATERWNRRAPAIAPPVAAGSVDTLVSWSYSPTLHVMVPDSPKGQIRQQYYEREDVIAWGAQQREVGRREVEGRNFIWTSSNPPRTCIQCNDKECIYGSGYCASCVYRFTTGENVHDLRNRAEKAEAELKQVNEWRAAALAENQALGELWAAKVEKAEAQLVDALDTNAGNIALLSKADTRYAALMAKFGDLHCKSCGTHEISLTKECHNSDCAEYANAQEVYAGWKI